MPNTDAIRIWEMMSEHCKHLSPVYNMNRCMYYGGKNTRLCTLTFCPVITTRFAKEISK